MYMLSFFFLFPSLYRTYAHFVPSPAVFLSPVLQAVHSLDWPGKRARHFDVTWTGAKAKPIDLWRTYELLEEVRCGE